MDTKRLKIVVNDREHLVAEGTNVAGLLAELKMPSRFVAVERNKRVVPRAVHAETLLEDGDRLEIVTLVGGG